MFILFFIGFLLMAINAIVDIFNLNIKQESGVPVFEIVYVVFLFVICTICLIGFIYMLIKKRDYEAPSQVPLASFCVGLFSLANHLRLSIAISTTPAYVKLTDVRTTCELFIDIAAFVMLFVSLFSSESVSRTLIYMAVPLVTTSMIINACSEQSIVLITPALFFVFIGFIILIWHATSELDI